VCGTRVVVVISCGLYAFFLSDDALFVSPVYFIGSLGISFDKCLLLLHLFVL
jgi:hypothetical protein